MCLDGWRDWVLHAVKVSTENAAEMRPAIARTVADFGPPVAIMRDLGSAGAKAVADYRQQAIPDLVCHYHFLAAAGRKLLDVEYAALRGQLRSSKVRSGLRELLRTSRGRARLREDLPALLLWVLEGEGRKDLPYPFALAHWEFYRRCAQFPQRAQRWLPRPRSRPEQGVLRQAEAVLAGLQRRDRLAWAVPRLERSWAAFSALRDVLRLRDDELPRGDRRTPLALRCPARAATRLQAIETVAKAYTMPACASGSPRSRRGDPPRPTTGRRPWPPSTARPSQRRRPCSATTRMLRCASAFGPGRRMTASAFRAAASSCRR